MTNETTILHNAVIWGHEEADALVIRGDRIDAVGCSTTLVDVSGETIRSIDLAGRVVLPGFIDAHVHLLHTGLVESGWRVDLALPTRDEALARIADAVRARGSGEWIIAYGWDESQWTTREYLTRAELDRLAPSNPLLAVRMDGHILTANTQALDRLPSSLPDALVDRPAGLLREEAASEALSQVLPDRTAQDEALSAAAALCHRQGITTVHTMTKLRSIPALIHRRTERRLRVTACPYVEDFARLEAVGLQSAFGDPWLRFGGIKIFADGSIGAMNAAVSIPYLGGGLGVLNHDDESLQQMIREAMNGGWQTVVHAIGDRAIDQVIRAHEVVGTHADLRHRIEHFELPTDSDLDRVHRLGLAVSMQPNFLGNWSGPERLYIDRIGEARDRKSNPLRAIVDRDIAMAFGSDGMPISPLYGIHWAANASYPEQRLTCEEAVERYTAGGAWFGFEEGSKGSIEPGMLADLVVLDEDPRVAPDRVLERTVEMTFVGGESVYEGGRPA